MIDGAIAGASSGWPARRRWSGPPPVPPCSCSATPGWPASAPGCAGLRRAARALPHRDRPAARAADQLARGGRGRDRRDRGHPAEHGRLDGRAGRRRTAAGRADRARRRRRLDHELAVDSLAFHLVGVTVWVGGLAALMLLRAALTAGRRSTSPSCGATRRWRCGRSSPSRRPAWSTRGCGWAAGPACPPGTACWCSPRSSRCVLLGRRRARPPPPHHRPDDGGIQRRAAGPGRLAGRVLAAGRR